MASDTHSGWQYSYSTNPQYPTNQPPPSKTIDLLFIHEINLVIKSLLLNLLYYFYPSNGGPRYTMDTSVFPYTADTVGNSFLSGRPRIE